MSEERDIMEGMELKPEFKGNPECEIAFEYARHNKLTAFEIDYIGAITQRIKPTIQELEAILEGPERELMFAPNGEVKTGRTKDEIIEDLKQRIAALESDCRRVCDERAASFAMLDGAVGGTGLTEYQPEIDIAIKMKIEGMWAKLAGLEAENAALLIERDKLKDDLATIPDYRTALQACARARPEGYTIVDFQRVWLDQNETRIKKLEAENAALKKQVQDALIELPHVAGPLAHRLRIMREQYDGWCKQYKEEIVAAESVLRKVMDHHHCESGTACLYTADIDFDAEGLESKKCLVFGAKQGHRCAAAMCREYFGEEK